MEQSRNSKLCQQLPSSSVKKPALIIQHCHNCYSHCQKQCHDEQLYHQLLAEIKKQVKQNGLQLRLNVNEVPKCLVSQKNLKKPDYYNQQTKRVERFPRIGAFQVYYQNIVLFSKLYSSLQVQSSETGSKQVEKINNQTSDQFKQSKKSVQKSESQQHNQSSNQQNLNKIKQNIPEPITKVLEYFQPQKISTRFLSKLIIQTIIKLNQNLCNIKFLSSIENIYRFRQLEWNPLGISMKSSLIEDMLTMTRKDKRQNIDQVMKVLQKMVQGKDVPWLGRQARNIQKKEAIPPYTYYGSVQKQSRIKSIYKIDSKDSHHKRFSCSPKFKKTKNNVTLKKDDTIQKKITENVDKQPYPKQIKANIDRTKQKRNNKQKVKPGIKRMIKTIDVQKPQTVQLKDATQSDNFQDKQLTMRQSQEGFIVKKKHYKRTSVPNFYEVSASVVSEDNPSELRKCGFLYNREDENSRKKDLKEKLLEGYVGGVKRDGKMVGRLIKSGLFTQQVSGQEIIEDKQVNDNRKMPVLNKQHQVTKEQKPQKIFRRNHTPTNISSLMQRKSRSKNLVRSCLSQRKDRPLSSTVASRFGLINRKYESSNCVSQKEIKNSNKMNPKPISQQRSLKNENSPRKQMESGMIYSRRQRSIQPIEGIEYQNQIKRLQSERNEKWGIGENTKIESHRQRPKTSQKRCFAGDKQNSSARKRYSRDFVQENIRKASLTKRVPNVFASASLWQKMSKSSSKCNKERSKKSTSCIKSSVNKLSQFQSISEKDHKRSSSLIKHNVQIKNSQAQGQIKEEQVKQAKELNCDKGRKQELQGKMNKMSADEGVFGSEKEEDAIDGRGSGEIVKGQQNEAVREDRCEQQQQGLQQQQSTGPRRQQKVKTLSHYSNLITYTLGSQQQQSVYNQTSPTQTLSYYNHKLSLKTQPYAFQPASITKSLPPTCLSQSKNFHHLLTTKNISVLQKQSKFDLNAQQVQQSYEVMSLRQLYKMDGVGLFPGNMHKGVCLQERSQIDEGNKSGRLALFKKVVQLLLSTNYKLITRLFQNVKTVSYLGYYGVWLFSIKNNRFQLVVLNDQFCVVPNLSQGHQSTVSQGKYKDMTQPQEVQVQYIYSGPSQLGNRQKVIYQMVLEKAVAQIMGGYGNLQQLSFGQIYKMLTGCQYVEFPGVSAEKLLKILSQGNFLSTVNKKSLLYALPNNGNNIQEITSWTYNQKSPLLSLVHFRTYNSVYSSRLQSMTLAEFSKQFNGLTVVFVGKWEWNWIDVRTEVKEKGKDRKSGGKGQKDREGCKVVEVTNWGCSSKVCYVGVSHEVERKDAQDREYISRCWQDEQPTFAKQNYSTHITLYNQLSQQSLSTFNQSYPSSQQQTNTIKYRYSGQITKSSQFFFEIRLKPGRNLFFIEVTGQKGGEKVDAWVKVVFCAEIRLSVREVQEEEVARVKCVGGVMNGGMKQNGQCAGKGDDVKCSGKRGEQSQKKHANTLTKDENSSKPSTPRKLLLKQCQNTSLKQSQGTSPKPCPLTKPKQFSPQPTFLQDQLPYNQPPNKENLFKKKKRHYQLLN